MYIKKLTLIEEMNSLNWEMNGWIAMTLKFVEGEGLVAKVRNGGF